LDVSRPRAPLYNATVDLVVREGMSFSAAAEKLGISRNTVASRVQRYRQALACGEAVNAAVLPTAVKEERRTPRIPWWVPESLIGEYREIARSSCEEDAASHVRRLKREMEGADR
jgi:transposase-like protein